MKKVLFAFLLLPLFVSAADIAVVTLASGDEYKAKVKLGIENKRLYCKQHGYDFIYSEESQDPSRHIYWSKIRLVSKALENPAYKWVVWMDADTLIMNLGTPLEDFIDDKVNFIITKDWNGINAGVFFVKNCDWSRTFLTGVYNRTDCIGHMWPEQQAIALELKDKKELNERVKIAPQRFFNSYPKELLENYRPLTSAYQPGDFLLHFASAGSSEKLTALFEKYSKEVRNTQEFPALDHYLGMHGFQLYPTHSSTNEGYMSDAQKAQLQEQLKLHPHIETIAEIGLNGGHSADNFFASCKNLKKFVSFDINMHAYTAKAVEYFLRKHKHAFEFVPGDSIVTVSDYAKRCPTQKFDLIYIDGNHAYSYAVMDILHCRDLAHPDTIVWIDDYNGHNIQKAVELLKKNGLLEIKQVHHSHDISGDRCWVEVKYLYNPPVLKAGDAVGKT